MASIDWETQDPNEEMVEPTPTEMHMVFKTTFRVLDTDGSGFIQANETIPAERGDVIENVIFRKGENGKVEPTGKVQRRTLSQARAEYIDLGDENRDGRGDSAEYREWKKKNLALAGIPARWRENTTREYGAVSAR